MMNLPGMGKAQWFHASELPEDGRPAVGMPALEPDTHVLVGWPDAWRRPWQPLIYLSGRGSMWAIQLGSSLKAYAPEDGPGTPQAMTWMQALAVAERVARGCLERKQQARLKRQLLGEVA